MLKRTLKIYSLFWHVLALWMIHASRSSSIPKNARLAPQILATLSAQVAAPVGTRAPRGGRFWRFASLRCDPSPRVVLSPPPAPPASIRGDTWYGGARRRCLGSASAADGAAVVGLSRVFLFGILYPRRAPCFTIILLPKSSKSGRSAEIFATSSATFYTTAIGYGLVGGVDVRKKHDRLKPSLDDGGDTHPRTCLLPCRNKPSPWA